MRNRVSQKVVGREREMYALWISLKDNINCGSKPTDVIHRHRPERCANYVSNLSQNKAPESQLIHQAKKLNDKAVIFRQGHKQTRYHEVGIGDPSRKVIEKIHQAASTTHPLKEHRSKKIKKVIKVKNSLDTLESFENYREIVKKKYCYREQFVRYPRSLVDGNEVLQFYSTTMACFNRKLNEESELCADPACRVCRIIQTGFITTHNGSSGIWLSTSSEDILSEDTTANIKRKKLKRAVIVCRTVAGKIRMADEEQEGEFDSVGIRFRSKLHYLFVQNPNAILPCFIIVFN